MIHATPDPRDVDRLPEGRQRDAYVRRYQEIADPHCNARGFVPQKVAGRAHRSALLSAGEAREIDERVAEAKRAAEAAAAPVVKKWEPHPVDLARLGKAGRRHVRTMLRDLRAEGASERALADFAPVMFRAAKQADREAERRRAEEEPPTAPVEPGDKPDDDQDDDDRWDEVPNSNGVRMYRAGKRRPAPVLYLKSYQEAAEAMKKARR